MTKYCVFLRGDNLPLAQAEVSAFLRFLDGSSHCSWDGRFGVIECEKAAFELLMRRAVLVRVGGELVLSSESIDHFISELDKVRFQLEGKEEVSFAIRIQDLEDRLDSKEKLKLASIIGEKIRSETKWSVSLSRPNQEYAVYITGEAIHLANGAHSKVYKEIIRDSSRDRPFFHPSMMNRPLARIMCNIAGVLPNHIVLDPFCGGGGILLEAAMIGAEVVGIDLNWKLLRGAMANLMVIDANFNLVKADAQQLPISKINRVVTDPPYGRSSSTHGVNPVSILEQFFNGLDSLQMPIVACICADSRMNLELLIDDMKGHVLHRVPIRVHGSLTRELFCITI